MKKLTIMFTGLAFLLAASSFSGPGDPVSEIKTEKTVPSAKTTTSAVDAEFNIVKVAFKKHFDAKSIIRWKITDDFYFVYFVTDDHSMFAAFSKGADLLAVSRNISKSELPLNVAENLKRNFNDLKIEENVLEMSLQGETIYYINANNADRNYKLKSNASGDVSIISKSKKKRLIGSIG